MRWRIITTNVAVIVVVSVLLMVLVHAQLGDLVSNRKTIQESALRSANAASAQLQFDAVRVERWLDSLGEDVAIREAFGAGAPNARAEAATAQCNRLLAMSKQQPEFSAIPPAIIALVDPDGVTLGRNGTAQMRGTDLAKTYPRLKETLAKGESASDIWFSRQLSHQWFVSYSAIRGANDKVIGGIVYGTPVNDERFSRIADQISGTGIALTVNGSSGVEVIAKASSVVPEVVAAIVRPPVADTIQVALKQGRLSQISGGPSDWVLAASALGTYGGGNQAVIVAVSPSTLMDLSGVYYAIIGVALLGIVLVIIGGVLLGNYVSRPIEELEDGLLQILNGRSDLRFQIEHDVLGGLVFRINTMLNQLMGVDEDDTDSEGRPSTAPSANAFQRALDVDERMSTANSQVDVAAARSLASEPEAAYYSRVYGEYISAKRTIGDPVDHITEESFTGRIRQREAEMAQKIGRQVRYQVQLRGREVVLIAVPLP